MITEATSKTRNIVAWQSSASENYQKGILTTFYKIISWWESGKDPVMDPNQQKEKDGEITQFIRDAKPGDIIYQNTLFIHTGGARFEHWFVIQEDGYTKQLQDKAEARKLWLKSQGL